MAEVTVMAEVRPSEDPRKVMRSVSNVIDMEELKLEEIEGRKYVVGRAVSHRPLLKLRQLIWSQGIQDAARSMLSRGVMSDDVLTFMLNKQAAYVGVVSFVSDPSESPLGPIVVTVRYRDMRRLIDWLAPRTYKGKVMYDVSL